MPPPEPPSTPSVHSSPYSPASQRVSMDQSRASFEAGRKSGEGYMRFSSPPVTAAAAGGAGAGGGFSMGGMPLGGQGGGQGGGLGLNQGGGAGQGQQAFGGYPGMSSFGSAMPPHHQQPGHASYPQMPMNNMMGIGAGGGAGAGGGGGQWAMGVNDATAQMGLQFGRSAITAGQDYVEKNVSGSAPLSQALLSDTPHQPRSSRGTSP